MVDRSPSLLIDHQHAKGVAVLLVLLMLLTMLQRVCLCVIGCRGLSVVGCRIMRGGKCVWCCNVTCRCARWAGGDAAGCIRLCVGSGNRCCSLNVHAVAGGCMCFNEFVMDGNVAQGARHKGA